MQQKVKRRKAPGQIAHFSWPDGLVLIGALLLVSVALYERRWFFLVIGLSIVAALGIRVAVTRALAGRALAGRAQAGRALAGRAAASGQPAASRETKDPDDPSEGPIRPEGR